MGITYKAFDTNLVASRSGHQIASETARQRFARGPRGCSAQARMATVFHLGRKKTISAMEFVDGETVSPHQAGGRGAGDYALNCGAGCAPGAAQASLVHRDISRRTSCLCEDGGEISVKVIDFGLARTLSDTRTRRRRRVDSQTPPLPVGATRGAWDRRALRHLFSRCHAGMLAGKTPFSGSTAQVMSQHLHHRSPFASLKVSTRPWSLAA
jgi:hypothetical protein